jgi:hypothetical protein
MPEFHNDRLKRLAYHEAGHAIVAEASGIEVEGVNLTEYGRAGIVHMGRRYIEPATDRAITVAGLLAVAMAGCPFAQAIDLDQENYDLPAWYQRLPDPASSLRAQAETLFDDLDAAQAILTRHWRAVATLAYQLKNHKQAGGKLLRSIFADPLVCLLAPEVRHTSYSQTTPPVSTAKAHMETATHLLTGLTELRTRKGLSNVDEPKPAPKPTKTPAGLYLGGNTISNRPRSRRLPYEHRAEGISYR